MGIQRAFWVRNTSPCLAPDGLAHELQAAAESCRAICLMGTPSLASSMMVEFVSSRRKYPSYCSFSA